MSVPVLPRTTVTLMLHVPTLLGASPVHVTKDTLEMEPFVTVRATDSNSVSSKSCTLLYQILMSVLMLPLTTVTLMLCVLTLLGTSPVHVTKDTLEMELSA